MFAALCGLWAAPTLAGDPASPSNADHAAPAAGQTATPHDRPATESDSATAETKTAEPADGRHPSDPNYRYHNGRWWYWQNDAYLMWNGQRWLAPGERQRSYSYAPSNARRRSYSYTPTEEGMPTSDASGMRRGFVAPSRVEYQKVLPSFGVRSAGSKVLGAY
jgi:hypothetical protein